MSKSREVVEYNMENTYKVNDVIFHKTFEEEGTVVEVGVTRDNEKKMTVDFKNAGRKRLIMGVELKKAAK